MANMSWPCPNDEFLKTVKAPDRIHGRLISSQYHEAHFWAFEDLTKDDLEKILDRYRPSLREARVVFDTATLGCHVLLNWNESRIIGYCDLAVGHKEEPWSVQALQKCEWEVERAEFYMNGQTGLFVLGSDEDSLEEKMVCDNTEVGVTLTPPVGVDPQHALAKPGRTIPSGISRKVLASTSKDEFMSQMKSKHPEILLMRYDEILRYGAETYDWREAVGKPRVVEGNERLPSHLEDWRSNILQTPEDGNKPKELQITKLPQTSTMPPLTTPISSSSRTETEASDRRPRIICYHQTIVLRDKGYVSMLPLLYNHTGITHIIIAAFHINSDPEEITLNDDPPQSPIYAPLWEEVPVVQRAGVKIMGMLGGAAQGSYTRLDGSQAQFDLFYRPLLAMIRQCGLDGLDLDVEEPTSLEGIVRLIDRLKADLGGNFIITLTPVAAALMNRGNLSGFDYFQLERIRGSEISWYNTQFYNGWGDALMYPHIINMGWSPWKVVMGLLTNPGNGSRGYIPPKDISQIIGMLSGHYQNFGGVVGWEYFNSMPGGVDQPWQWAAQMSLSMGMREVLVVGQAVVGANPV
ncbi:hypothetical protein Egran_03634 [Elaphomyces granulatus]|uniref:GH18 domain-containing protein n=1 Tax=Elaphomyces granulatus TaxID=519963 RepID=A0A232LWT2_9EURO|nr:hypothetical protein Egran_03634 [Elaphomyces granulatus]